LCLFTHSTLATAGQLNRETDRQGKSGPGLEAQRSAVADYLNGGKWSRKSTNIGAGTWR